MFSKHGKSALCCLNNPYKGIPPGNITARVCPYRLWGKRRGVSRYPPPNGGVRRRAHECHKIGQPACFLTRKNMKIALAIMQERGFFYDCSLKHVFHLKKKKEYSFLFYKTEQYRNINNISENLMRNAEKWGNPGMWMAVKRLVQFSTSSQLLPGRFIKRLLHFFVVETFVAFSIKSRLVKLPRRDKLIFKRGCEVFLIWNHAVF